MSSAEIDLGAKLYIDAVASDLPAVLAAGEADSTEYRNLKLSFRDMSRFLVKNGVIGKNADGWMVNEDAVSNLSEEDAKRFQPYYDTVVRGHEKAAGQLITDGKQDYVDNFRELHADKIIEVAPQASTRVSGEDLENIAGASLSLLEATRLDPANAAFIKGLDSEAQESLWNVLEVMNYLMPGENPDREAPIGEQTLRGTPEQQDALYHQAAALVSNIEVPEKLNVGDRPMAAVLMLRNAVAEARMEEFEDTRAYQGSPEMFHDSDLTQADANSLFNVISMGTRMVNSAQWDTHHIGDLIIPTPLAEDVKTALADYDDKMIETALSSGNFEAPNIDADKAVRLAKSISWLREAVTTTPEDMSYTGDDGGSLTESSAGADSVEMEDGEEFDNAFDAQGADTPMATEDMGAEKYGKAEAFTRMTESFIAEFDRTAQDMVQDGTLETLRQHAGRADINLEEFTSQAAFGSFEEAMGEGRVETTPEVTNRVSEAMSAAQHDSLNPRQKERLRVARIDPKHEPFKGYVPGAPSVAAKRLTRWLDDNMVQDGQPNVKLRSWLRQARDLPVVGANRQEAEAMRSYAHDFVEREGAEHRARMEAKNEKIGVSSFQLDAPDVKRAIDVAAESPDGRDAQFRVAMDKTGGIKISHPDAPQMTSRLENPPAELASSDKSPREFGGFIQLSQLKAAYETGADQIAVNMMGESVQSVIGRTAATAERLKTTQAPKRKFEDLALS